MALSKQVQDAIDKYLAGTATAEERQLVQDWYYAQHREVVEVQSADSLPEVEARILSGIKHQLADNSSQQVPRKNLQQPLHPEHRVHPFRSAWFRYAAILLLIAGTATVLYRISQPEQEVARQQPNHIPADTSPRGNRAVLTLADGSTVVLDNASNGELASEGSTKVIKLADGQLTYQPVKDPQTGNDVTGYNTITTPRGGQYQIILPDGSKVWLNAASSIRFPVSFNGPSRITKLQGEAYFEIAENKKQPFIVETNGLEAQVLGTSFNINAYEDESLIKTTLLTGSLKVKNQHASHLMFPGEQTLADKEGHLKVLTNYNTQDAIAWKNGYFRLTSADVPSIMRQIARWYNVDIVYEGDIPSRRLTGEVPRSMELAKVVEALEASGIKIKMKSNKLIIGGR